MTCGEASGHDVNEGSLVAYELIMISIGLAKELIGKLLDDCEYMLGPAMCYSMSGRAEAYDQLAYS